MKWNRIGRFAVVLAAGLVLAGGCRSTKTDRIRYLEAENAKVTRENTDLSDQVVAERSGKMKEEARRETAEAELRAARMRYELLLQRENAAMSELDKKDGLDVRTAEDGTGVASIASSASRATPTPTPSASRAGSRTRSSPSPAPRACVGRSLPREFRTASSRWRATARSSRWSRTRPRPAKRKTAAS